MFFSSWDNLLRVLILAPGAYIGLVLFLRISGKRTLSTMNIFDMVVTVAFGSTLATIILPAEASLLDGLLTLGLLICLQFVVARLAVASRRFARLVKSEPTLLLHHGRMLTDAMHRERIVEEEIAAAIRKAGLIDVADAEAVILETNGALSVISRAEGEVDRNALRSVVHPGKHSQ